MSTAAATASRAARTEAHTAASANDQAGPPVCTDASGARIRTVCVHLTEFVPGLRGAALKDPRRWKTFFGVTPLRMVRSLLKRLELAPRDVQVAPEVNGDVAILGVVPPEVLRQVSAEAGERAPFAIFWDGLTEAEVRAAIDQLAAAGWTPSPVAEAA